MYSSWDSTKLRTGCFDRLFERIRIIVNQLMPTPHQFGHDRKGRVYVSVRGNIEEKNLCHEIFLELAQRLALPAAGEKKRLEMGNCQSQDNCLKNAQTPTTTLPKLLHIS